MNKNNTPQVSICMVSFNCVEVIQECLESLQTALQKIPNEIIITDNASQDKSIAKILAINPRIRVIQNNKNLGFSVATNQAIKQSSGKFVLMLNTDTILNSGTISKMIRFLNSDKNIGIVGPKVLNQDGSFQYQCRRGYPTPLASFAYLSGLDRVFPDNKSLGQYLLRYEPQDKTMNIWSASGCCMLVRRTMINQIGLLDEEIFAFGEDIDFCVRAKKAGWSVVYFPESEIIHLGGQGGAQSAPLTKIWGIHQAMKKFYEKHMQSDHNPAINTIVKIGILCSFVLQSAQKIMCGNVFRIFRKI